MSTTWTLETYEEFTRLHNQLREALEKAEKLIFEKELTHTSPRKYLALLYLTAYEILTGWQGITAEELSKLSGLILDNDAWRPGLYSPYTLEEFLEDASSDA